jgi:putative membrane protein
MVEEAVEMMDGYSMSGWAWLVMTLGVFGFWALVAVVAVALLRRPGQRDQQQRPGVEELLAERLARGEIDADDYRQRLHTLQEATDRR